MVKKKMKKIFLILLCLCCICIYFPVSSADPAIMITSYELSPSVLLPGDEAVLTVTITNSETTATRTDNDIINGMINKQIVETISATIENIWIVSDGDGTYSISASDNYEDVGDLAPAASMSISFLLSAHENISSGLYFPLVRIDVDDYQDVRFPIPIRISNLSAHLVAKNVPSKISNSGSTQITLTAANNLKTEIKDISITANDDAGFEVIPKSMYIGNMEAESAQDLSFSIHSTDTGGRFLPFTMTYRNGENVHQSMINLSLEVVQTADVSPVLYEIKDQLPKGESERITLEVFNAKTETITGVIVIPETNLSVSPSQYFIGSMDPDDVFSASFDISTDGVEIGDYSIGFKVSYKQDNDYFESPVVSDSIEVTAAMQTEESNFPLIVVLIVIAAIVIIVLFFNMRKRGKRK